MKTIGEKIYNLRKLKGLSQEELGFEIGVSRQAVSKWEADFMKPNMENIRQLCVVFNVTANYFFSEDENTDSPTAEPQEQENNSVSPKAEAQENTDKQSNKKFLITLIAITSVLNVLSIIFIGLLGNMLFAPDKWSLTLNSRGIYLVLFILSCIVLGISIIAEIVFANIFIKQTKQK